MEREPATEFWSGYRRPPETRAALLAALGVALDRYPTMRFGQMLSNMNLDGRDPFSMWDEEWITLLKGEFIGP